MKKAVLPIFASTIDSKLLESWNSLDAIAVGVKSSEEGPLAIQNPVSKSVAARLDVDFATELALWPEFTGKAGEIIELPVGAADGIERLYLVGVGSQSREDYRKAGATLGRKTKGTGFHVLNGVVNESKYVGTHLLAIALSQYVWNLKSETKKKSACRFITFGKFDDELSALQVRMEAIYTARPSFRLASVVRPNAIFVVRPTVATLRNSRFPTIPMSTGAVLPFTITSQAASTSTGIPRSRANAFPVGTCLLRDDRPDGPESNRSGCGGLWRGATPSSR